MLGLDTTCPAVGSNSAVETRPCGVQHSHQAILPPYRLSSRRSPASGICHNLDRLAHENLVRHHSPLDRGTDADHLAVWGQKKAQIGDIGRSICGQPPDKLKLLGFPGLVKKKLEDATNIQVQKEEKRRTVSNAALHRPYCSGGAHDRWGPRPLSRGKNGAPRVRCQLTTPHAALYFPRGILEIFSLLELVTNIHSTEYIGTSIDTTEHRTTDSRPRQPDWYSRPTALLSPDICHSSDLRTRPAPCTPPSLGHVPLCTTTAETWGSTRRGL